ncbi:NUDIX domain-containing protein [Terriglobus albidus]|uniref:NUDIX domain-containing protein n=1 Tax=Terriglobus albidus TaxID=1592106 RepID=A0A5B9E950_9BACT|nr:NUDIX hydrolase [Terriglobus albidus]QEE28752.1 NUDIX domain-containing protein [Terriglobus albidus]
MSDTREYPSAPVVGVGAIVFQDDKVLLVRRGREPLKGEWSLPGGRLELGEHLEAAVVREVKEETGLDVSVVRHAETLERIFREEERVRYHYVLVDFLCEVTGGELLCGDDAADAAWFPVDAVLQSEIAVAQFTLEVLNRVWDRARATRQP